MPQSNGQCGVSTLQLQPHEVERIIQEKSGIARENAKRHAAEFQQLSAERELRKISPLTESEVAAYEHRQRDREAAERIGASGVRPHYRDAKLNDASHLPAELRADWLSASEAVALMLDRPAQIILLGGRGGGKTQIGSALVLAACRLGRTARYVDAAAIFDECRASQRDDSARTLRDVIERWVRPHLLVVDESTLGLGRGDTLGLTDFEQLQLTRIVDGRYSADRPTLLIANAEADAARVALGESIWDRCFDGGGLIECTWPSLRGRLITAGKH
jgi:DNA replication protein DnaC